MNKQKDRSGAGALIIVQGKALLIQRGNMLAYPNTFAPPGGRIDKGEIPFAAALRETREEVNIDLRPFPYNDKYVQPLTNPNEVGTYTTFIYILPSYITENDFDVKIDKESIGWGWFTFEEMKRMDLHPGVYNLLEYLGMEA